MRKLIVALFCLVPVVSFGQEPAKAAAPEPKPEEKAAPAQAQGSAAAAPGEYEVVDVKLGTGVQDREPQGVAETFKMDAGRVYCWTKVNGPEGGGEIKHAWYKGSEKMSEVTLVLKYKSVRTWSYKTLPSDAPGDWRVDVLAPDGTVLKSVAFKVE